MIGILIKNRIRAVISRICSVSGRKSNARTLGFLGIYLLVILIFASMSASTAYILALALIPGAQWLYYLIFMIISVTATFVLGVFESKAELFECKDNDLLLSMPIKPRDVVLSRMAVVMIYNYVINAIIFIPAIVIYAIFAKSAPGILGGILVFLLLPLFSSSLSAFVGYLVAEISSRIKYKNFVTVFFCLVFLGIYFVFMDMVGNNIEEFVAYLAGISDQLANDYKILYFIGNAALLSPLSFISVALVSIAVAAIACTLICGAYIRIVTEKNLSSRTKYRPKELKKRSALIAITKKDIARFFASPIYVLNGGIGSIMAVIVGGAAIVKRDELFQLAGELGFSADTVAMLGTAVVMLTLSMSIISAASLSLEGKGCWIIKSLPVEGRVVLLAKALMQFVISAPAAIVATVLILIAASPSFIYSIVCILASLLALFSVLGIIVNVALPKLEYDNEAQVVKQSMATIVSMLLDAIASFGIAIGVFFISTKSEALSAIYLFTLPFVLLMLTFAFLCTVSEETYNSLNL